MPQDFSFHHACERGDKNTVVKMLKRNGKDILKQPGLEYGQSPLHVCCEAGREELVQYFLDKFNGKIDINAVDKNGWTPLHSACKNGNLEIIELLLRKNAYQRAITNEGASPLHYFVRNGDQNDPLKHSRVMKLLIDGSFIDSENKHGETPLHQAAMKDRFQNVAYLVNAKADPNRITRHGETPLHFAARGNSHESTTILLQANADPTIETSDGVNVYSIAKKWDPSKIKKTLYEWYVTHKKPMPAEMKDDFEVDNSDDSEKKIRKKKRNPRTNSGNGKSPKCDKKKGRDKEKDISRVSSLRTMEQSARRASHESKDVPQNIELRTAAGTAIRAERRRSNSINDLGPEVAEEFSAASLSQRIEMMQKRAAAREIETKGKEGDSIKPARRVNALVSNFEQLSSPKDQRVADNASPIDRIRKLKQDVASVVDIEAIEEQVSGQKEENSLMNTLKDIGNKKLSLSSVSDSKVIDSLKDGWACQVCKNVHKDVPLFFFCAAPDDYEALEATEKSNRAKLSSDLCSIEKNSKCYVRGLLELNLKNTSSGSRGSKRESEKQITVTWGLWVAVSTSDFEKFINNWNNNDSLTINGTLNNNIPSYNNCLGLAATVTTRPGGFRPLISLAASDNMLSKDFTSGIPIEKLSSLIEFVFHTSKDA